jgi:hypothetical protein
MSERSERIINAAFRGSALPGAQRGGAPTARSERIINAAFRAGAERSEVRA